MKRSVVIFDLFGTLVENFASWATPMQQAFLGALGVHPEEFNAVWRQTTELRTNGTLKTLKAGIEYASKALGGQIGPAQIEEAIGVRMDHFRRALTPRPDAVPTLSTLKTQGYRIGLLSNCSDEIPELWPDTTLAPLVEEPIFSCSEGLKKPSAEIYHLACRRLGTEPGACFYVADGENHELATAATVGMHPILIRPPVQNISGASYEEARQWQGDTVATLTEVPALLQRNRT